MKLEQGVTKSTLTTDTIKRAPLQQAVHAPKHSEMEAFSRGRIPENWKTPTTK